MKSTRQLYINPSTVAPAPKRSPRLSSPAAFRRWLGLRPRRVPPRVECVERKVFRDYIREKLVFDVEPDLASVAWLCRPRTPGRLPGVLCCHGAGPGKDPLVGLFGGKPCSEYHKCVAVQLAMRGFVALAPDRRGYGERNPLPFPSQRCDTYRADLESFYVRTRHASLSALDTWDCLQALDVLASRDGVDAGRLACLGVYDGGTAAAGAAILDRRIRAVMLACYEGPASFGGLLASRPLHLQAPAACGVRVTDPDDVRRCYVDGGGRALNVYHFDGVLELDFPPLAAWLETTLA